MHVLHPSCSSMCRIQDREGAYYFSAAFEVVLRKHGLIPQKSLGGGFVCRQVEWKDDLELHPLIFEGPLSTSVQEKHQIQARSCQVEELKLSTPEGASLGTLKIYQSTVRRIPTKKGEQSDPVPFVSPDPFWNTTAIHYQELLPSAEAVPILLARDDAGREQVVGVRQNNQILLGVPVLDLIARQHTTPPYEDAGFYAATAHFDANQIEAWLLNQIEQLFHAHGRTVLRLGRWPANYHSALSIRHDYDRLISDEALQSLLSFYRKTGVKSTWFWRLLHGAAHEQAHRVIAEKHEVALHTETTNLESFCDEEVRFFQEQMKVHPLGLCAHGGAGAVGYVGQRQMEWALANGMTYGEMLLGPAHPKLPHQAILTREGIPRPSSLILPAQHKGLDINTKPEGHCYDSLLVDAQKALDNGEHVVVMNHPDVHIPELQKLLTNLNLSRTWKVTMEEACRWFAQVKANTAQMRTNARQSIYFADEIPTDVECILSSRHGEYRTMIPEGTSALHLDHAEVPQVSIRSRSRKSWRFWKQTSPALQSLTVKKQNAA